MIFNEEGVNRVFNVLMGRLREYRNDKVFLRYFFYYIIGFLNFCDDNICVDIRSNYNCIIYEICFFIICLLIIKDYSEVE